MENDYREDFAILVVANKYFRKHKDKNEITYKNNIINKRTPNHAA